MVFAVLFILLAIYIVYQQRQLRIINRQLAKRLLEKTRQPLSLDLINRELNNLASNINKCLSEEEKLRLESIRREKQIKDLIANISHDLRTPLTAIRGYQQLMEKGALSDDQKKKLNIAQKHADELGKMIDQLFEYSYLMNIAPELQLERVNLTGLVIDCLAESVSGFEENGLAAHFEESPAVFVLADKGLLIRVIRNLIRNCIKHSDGDINVQMFVTQNAGVSFRNPVKNASELDAERIFDRFYTADKARNASTGLGLSIVKLLMEQMGGGAAAFIQDGMIEIRVELPYLEM